jgi:hypothetical protein
MVFLHFPNGISKAKFKSSGDRASHCFRPFWIGKLSDICLPIWTLLYVSFKHIVINLTNFMGTPNYENIVQYFPPHWIIGFLEVYKYLMYCLIVLPLFLQYLTNAENLISSWYVTLKPTLMINNNFFYVWTSPWEENIW